MITNPSLVERCAAIDLLILDVDGVLTEGCVVYGAPDMEIKAFHVRDGSGLKAWHDEGRRTAIVTGRTSSIVDRRANELGIDPVVQGASDKLAAYERIKNELEKTNQQICYVGDDLPDLAIFQHCGLAVAVADACAEIRSDAHYITRQRGGRGAVRETIELILSCQGRWPSVIERYRNSGSAKAG